MFPTSTRVPTGSASPCSVLHDADFTFGFADVLNGKTFWTFLKRLVMKYRGREVFLVIDNAPCHNLPPKGKEGLADNRHRIELNRHQVLHRRCQGSKNPTRACHGRRGPRPAQMFDPYSPPKADVERASEGFVAWPLDSVVSVWQTGLRLFMQNLGVVVAIVVPFYAPVRLIENYLVYQAHAEEWQMFKASLLVDSVVTALVTPAILYAMVESQRRGRSVGAWRAVAYGSRRALRVFSANLVAGLYMLFGLVLLILPGVVFALRFSVVAHVVSLEPADSWPSAQRRCQELTAGRLGLLAAVFMPLLLAFMLASAAAGFVLVYADHWLLSAMIDLVLEVLFVLVSTVGLTVYVYARFGESHRGTASWTEQMRWVTRPVQTHAPDRG